ncbi:hypothetical protein SAMN05216510_3249 [Pseudomonas coleopterorum]|jgi:hypothetical protein|nr:hypothetical protein SAMN05216510_3249 [Pseudomonas coleopterorum]
MSKPTVLIAAATVCLVACAPSGRYPLDGMNSPDPWRKGPAVYREMPMGDPKRQHLCQVESSRPECEFVIPGY